MAYDKITPPSDPWLQTGLLASILANIFGGGKKTYRPDQFMPTRKRLVDDSPEQEERQKSILNRLFASMRRRKKE